MQRIITNHMPFYSHDGEKVIGKLSGYKLQDIANHLTFYKPSLRYPNRIDRIKSNVLGALCARYPNVWPGVITIAKEAHCSVAQAHRALRELELKDKLIVDVNSHLKWKDIATVEEQAQSKHKWTLVSDDAGKHGGTSKDTVQYFICDRKIFDVYQQQQAWEKRDKARDKANKKARHSAHSGETTDPSHRGVTPVSGERVTPLSGERILGTDTPLPGAATPPRGEATPIRGDEKQAPPLSPLRDEPTILTNHNNPPPNQPAEPENLWGRMVAVFSKTGKGQLNNRAGWKSVLSLSVDQATQTLFGLSAQETILWVFWQWVRERNLEGLKCPLVMFAEEFPATLAALKAQEERRTRKAEHAKKIADAEAKVREWRKSFDVLSGADFNSHKRGTPEWVTEVNLWLKQNPPPAELVEGDDGELAEIQGLADWAETEITWRVNQAEELLHYPDDPLCGCVQCQAGRQAEPIEAVPNEGLW